MTTRLDLYFGICDSEGLPEIRFSKIEEDTGDYSIKIKTQGMRTVREAIDAVHVGESYPIIRYGAYALVDNETKARELISYLKERFGGVEGDTRLLDCKHGKIRFFREAVVSNLSEKDKESLRSTLKESGLINEKELFWFDSSVKFFGDGSQ